MVKNYNLYLDDVRDPKTSKKFIIARSFLDAIKIVNNQGCPSYISFDHDLGKYLTGYDFAKWIVEKDLDNPGFIPKDFEFNVHSANPVGRDNIIGLLDNYLNNRSGNKNPQYGKIWIYNEELKKSKTIIKTNIIPVGWKKGRKFKF